MKRIICKLLVICALLLSVGTNYASAKEEKGAIIQAYDVETVKNTDTVRYTRSAKSTNPDIALKSLPSNVKNVSFTIDSNTMIRYNRITGKFVSTENPKVALSYSGPVNLSIAECTSSYRDGGKFIEYTYKLKIRGTYVTNVGVYCTIDYNDVTHSYKVYK